MRIIILSIFALGGAPLVSAANERLFHAVNSWLTDTRLDPIVNPGNCSGHVHSVFGNVQFGSTVGVNQVSNVDWQDDTGKQFLTTSNIIPNKSMYWAPSLYIYNPADGLYHIVPSYSRAYYRIEYRGSDGTSGIHPFPTYLRIVIGDASRRHVGPYTNVQDNIYWTNRTWDRATNNAARHGDWNFLKAASTADLNRMNELELRVHFPSCLRIRARHPDGGPRTWSADHRDHAAYLDSNLRCPESHPYHIPELDLEIRYRLDVMRRRLGARVVNNIDNWVLSNGDTTGASGHADFIAGWNEEFMQEIIDNCRFGRGVNCPIQKYIGASRAAMVAKTVDYSRPVPREVVSPVAKLPSMEDPCCIGC